VCHHCNRAFHRCLRTTAHSIWVQTGRADERRVRLERLGGGDAANLDIKVLTGRSRWLRMRVGDWRVIYRPADPGPGWYVARVVNRRDLDATVKQF
jgi:hypothetical protein